MKQKTLIATAAAALLLGTALVAGTLLSSTQSIAQTTDIHVANWLPNPKHPIAIALKAWGEKVQAESKGSLKVSVDSARIGKPQGQYDLVRKGVADVAWGLLAMTPGRFSLSQVIELPFASVSGEKGSIKATQLYKKFFAGKEFNDTKLLAIHVHGPGQMHTKTKVTKLEDMVGMKIRTVGGGVPWVKALGATPVVMPASKAHEALARGVTDGILFPWQAIQAFKLEKLVTHHFVVPNGLYTIAFFFTMNKKKYAGLSAQLRAVIDANAGESAAAFFGRAWDGADARALKKLRADKAHSIVQVSPAELSRLKDRAKAIVATWKNIAKKKGIDGDAVLAELAK